MCIICRNHFDKKDLFRIVLDSAEHKAVLDRNNSIQSRGLYICRNTECINSPKTVHIIKNMLGADEESVKNVLLQIKEDTCE